MNRVRVAAALVCIAAGTASAQRPSDQAAARSRALTGADSSAIRKAAAERVGVPDSLVTRFTVRGDTALAVVRNGLVSTEVVRIERWGGRWFYVKHEGTIVH